MRKLVIALAALLALAAPALAVTLAQKAAILSGVPTPPPPAVTAQATTRFTQDNHGPFTTSQTPVNNYLTAPGATTSACASGKPPTPFGLPCTGANAYVDNRDFFQGVSFITSGNPTTLGEVALEVIAGGANGANAASSGQCNNGNDKCIGLQPVSSGNPGYANLYFRLALSNFGFWPSACGGPTLTIGPVYPTHRYTLEWGTKTGLPWVALVDGTTKTIVGNGGAPFTCATSIWGASTFGGTGVSSGGSSILNTTPITALGAQPNATTAFKAGFGGSIGPAFAFVGAFPGSGGTPDSATLIAIATGQLNLLTSPPTGATCQAYYTLSDVGTWADSCGGYANLTASFTTTASKGPPAIAPAAVTINEKPSAGFTFRLDPSTIVPNASRQICYSGSPATGTVYRSGTWSSIGGGKPSKLIYRLYNSSGVQIAQQTVRAQSSGTWSVALSGVPYGTGYTDSVEWANSAKRVYKSALPFNVGLLLWFDSQSEGVMTHLVGNTGAALAYNNEIASVVEFPRAGYDNINDEAGKYAINVALSAYNTPGVAGNPSGSTGAGNAAGAQAFFLDYTAHDQATGDGATAFLKTAYAVSGCPVTAVYSGRSGHSREDFAFDHQMLPNALVASSAVFSSSSGSLYANANITADGGYAALILPGTLKLSLPYTGGATVTGTDNGAGGISFTDGSTGFTNYGFNEVTFDASTAASALGFANSGSNSNNGYSPAPSTYWWANSCRPSVTGCAGNAGAGIIKGSVSFASLSTVLGSGGAVVHLCVDQPNIPDALAHFCTNGTGTGSLAAQQIAITLGTTTIGQVINAINALPSAKLVTAQLSGGSSGYFELVPNSNFDIALTPASSCDAACQAGISTSWESDVETMPTTDVHRGEVTNSPSAPSQIPDGFGTFGDGVNCASGHVSSVLCIVQAPVSAYIEIIGAADAGTSVSNMEATENALWAKYAAGTNADANTPIAVLTYHRSMAQSSIANTDFGTYNSARAMTQAVGRQGGRYYPAGDLGLYDVVTYGGPHPSALPGGGWLWGQGLGESWIDAVTQNHSTSWSAGGSWSSAAFTTQTTFGSLSFSQCATAHTCILVTANLGSGDTAITTAGGRTASSGTGPATCPTYPSTVTDGDVSFICLGAVAARANSTAYSLGQVLQASPTNVTGAYSGGYLYQVTLAGTSAASNPITSANYVGNVQAHGGFPDGTTDLAFLGFALPYPNSLSLYQGQTVTANGNAYMAVGFNVANPIGRSCRDFYVEDTAVLSNRATAADGWDPSNPAGANFDGPGFSCTIVSATQVLLVRNSGTFTSGGTSLLYNAGYPSQRYAPSQPIDQETLGQVVTGNRGFVGLPNPTLPGVPIQPVLSPMAVSG